MLALGSTRGTNTTAIHGRCVHIGMLLVLLIMTACGREETAKTSETASPPAATDQASQPAGATPRVIDVTLSFVSPRFRPDPIVVQVGHPVQFNVTSADTRHTFIIEPLDIAVEVPQKSLNERVITKVVTPQEVGTFRMYCRIHERLAMEGTVKVTETGAAEN